MLINQKWYQNYFAFNMDFVLNFRSNTEHMLLCYS